MTELIKTRKQYLETLDFLKINRFAYDEANEIEDLIEALRGVVRAAEDAQKNLIALGLPPHNLLRERLIALPDWIKEDG